MTPTEYHPVRTAMMRNIHERRFRFAYGDHPDSAWALPRPPSEWNPRFGSHLASSTIPRQEWFDWERGVVLSEIGRHSAAACAGFMDRLCVFEDMLASVRRDGHPIIDLSREVQAVRENPATERFGNAEIDPDFTGSIYLHLGDTGVDAIGTREISGAYLNAERDPSGTVHGDIHFVGSDPNWNRAHEVDFYETLSTHQDAAVITYVIPPNGELSFRIDHQDIHFGNEENACALLRFARLGVDIALGKPNDLSADLRTEFFHGGPGVRPEYCRVDVMSVSRQPRTELTSERASRLSM